MQELTRYFASIGFKVDAKQLNDLEKTLKRVESSLTKFVSSFDAATGKIDRGLAKAQMAQKRALDIEGKQIRNATLKQRLEVAAAKTQAELAKATLATARAKESVARAERKQDAGGDGWKFGPSRSDMNRLRDRMSVREAMEQMRDSWRSRRRVTNVDTAEKLAYEADARRTSWRRQKSPGAGIMSEGSHWMRGFLPGFGGAWSVMQLNKMSQELYSINNAMLAVTGSTTQAANEMAYLDKVGNEFGLTVRQVGPEYLGFIAAAKGTKLEGNTQKGFGQFLKYSQVLGLSQEETKGSMRAISQMMGKGRIMSEELKGQLAEHMKGAIPLMAKAAGMSVDELLNSSGKLKSEDVLPKFFDLLEEQAKQGWEAYLKSSRRAQGLFRKQWEDTVKLIADKGLERGMARLFNNFTEGLKSSPKLIAAVGRAFDGLSLALSAPVELFTNINDALGQFSPRTQLVIAGVTGLSAALWLLNTRLGMIMAKVGIVALAMAAVSDMLAAFNGKNSSFGDALKEGRWGEVAIQVLSVAMALGVVFGMLKKIMGLGGGPADVVGGIGKNAGRLGRLATNPYVATAAAVGGTGWYIFDQTVPGRAFWKGVTDNSNYYSSKEFSDLQGWLKSFRRDVPGASQLQVQPVNPQFYFNITTDSPQKFEEWFKQNTQRIHNDAMLIFPLNQGQ